MTVSPEVLCEEEEPETEPERQRDLSITDNRVQAYLAREADALKKFVAKSEDMQFVVVPLVRRLLEDPDAAVNVVSILNKGQVQFCL